MKKNTIIGARPQLGGDTVFCEPILHYWKIKYPESEITWCIANKCKQFARFWRDHPLIDHLLISSDPEGDLYEIDGKTYNQKTDELPFDVRTPHFNPPAPTDYTYNTPDSNCVTVAWKMAGLDLSDYYNLPREYQRPRLYRKDKSTNQNYISIFPFAGYGQGFARSPSDLWWKAMIEILIAEGYAVVHFGHPSEPTLSKEWNYYKLTYLPLYEQVCQAADSRMAIGTDSGSMWLLGAQNAAPLINLLTFHMPNHNQNPLALAPMHYSKKQIDLFHPASCSHISHLEVLAAVKTFDALKNLETSTSNV